MDDSYLGNRGYSIIKTLKNTALISSLKKELTVKPFVNKQFQPDAKPFSVFLESKRKIYIPRYFGINKLGIPKENKIVQGTPIDIKFSSKLRPNQIPVVEKFIKVAHETGGGIISVPCGFGKTVLALYLVAALKVKTLVIVHKEFLMDQWKERIEFFLPNARVGKIQGDIVNIDDKDIKHIEYKLHKVFQLKYKDSQDKVMAKNTCLPIGTFCTSYARVILHRIMRHVGYENVVYTDTDCVQFRFVPENQEKCLRSEVLCKTGNILKLNSVLGGLTCELDHSGLIQEMVALAPKTYSQKILSVNDKESFVVKAKGYTVDNLVGKIINFDSYKNMMIRGFENLEKYNNTLTSG